MTVMESAVSLLRSARVKVSIERGLRRLKYVVRRAADTNTFAVADSECGVRARHASYPTSIHFTKRFAARNIE